MDNFLAVINERFAVLEAKLEKIITNDLWHINQRISRMDLKLWVVLAGLVLILVILLFN